MSETKKERRPGAAGRALRERPGKTVPEASYAIVASGENVVMVNTQTGQTWAMVQDGGRLVWQPVGFEAPAPRAPRGVRPAGTAEE